MKTIKHKRSILVLILFAHIAFSQTEGVSIKNSPGAPHASAMLDVESTSKGVLVPRVALTNTTSNSPVAVTPAEGLLVYNTASNSAVAP